jgi:hypothetical protein
MHIIPSPTTTLTPKRMPQRRRLEIDLTIDPSWHILDRCKQAWPPDAVFERLNACCKLQSVLARLPMYGIITRMPR